ncbi:MAG: transglycosylase SLT domain-containing protein [Ignavibacteriales bacterium]|nr:transglycosylase SLT domain-containing protein [Ignavibacteriales bacterium]
MNDLSLKIENNKHLSRPIETNSRYDQKQKDKIASAAKQFESLLTSMMLKSMNKTTGGMFGEEGYGSDMFDSIFEQEIASKMSETRSLGIAEMLYKKITGEELSSEMRHKISVHLNPGKIHNTQPSSDSTKVQPSTSAIERLNNYEKHIEEAASTFGIDKNVIKSIIMTESAANNKAVSGARAKGLMQLMDSTATDMGVRNVFNPKENIFGGTKYFAQMLRQYSGDIKLALAAYNAGPQNVEKFNGVPPFGETKNYINKVLGYLEHFNKRKE